MQIEGLDYNTQREKLVLSEYGREIQQMVDMAVALPTKRERQRCAETIINIMDIMNVQPRNGKDYEHKLWDHLAIMSGFRLDIDYPYDITQAAHLSSKPEPMEYPMKKIPVRHYGSMIFESFEKLKSMPPGEKRDQLTKMVAKQMKRNLVQWGHGAPDDSKVVADMARFTDGKIEISPDIIASNRKNSSERRKRKK